MLKTYINYLFTYIFMCEVYMYVHMTMAGPLLILQSTAQCPALQWWLPCYVRIQAAAHLSHQPTVLMSVTDAGSPDDDVLFDRKQLPPVFDASADGVCCSFQYPAVTVTEASRVIQRCPPEAPRWGT